MSYYIKSTYSRTVPAWYIVMSLETLVIPIISSNRTFSIDGNEYGLSIHTLTSSLYYDLQHTFM